MRKYFVYSILLVVVSFIIGFSVYSMMPNTIASHWDSEGNVNGSMSKFWGVFLMPIISAFFILLFLVLPNLDPLKKNYEGFMHYYDFFIALLISFLFYIYLLTLLWNLGYVFNMVLVLIPAFALLFFYIGHIIGHAKRNWFFGIRTPWTLSSDYIWDKTNKLGGLLFKLCGIISLLGFLFQKIAFLFILIPVLLSAIISMVYSYSLFKSENKLENKNKTTKTITKKITKTKSETKSINKKSIKKNK
jgi:uncharacterized membrane protein